MLVQKLLRESIWSLLGAVFFLSMILPENNLEKKTCLVNTFLLSLALVY